MVQDFDVKKEAARVIGVVNYKLYGPDGTLKDERVVPNLITNAGFDYLCDAIATTGTRPPVMNWIAIGTSNTAFAATQTLLIAEVARVAGTYAHTVGTTSLTLQATFNPGVGTGGIQESGMFNVVTANTATMLNRQVFSIINKGALDTLIVTWQILLS